MEKGWWSVGGSSARLFNTKSVKAALEAAAAAGTKSQRKRKRAKKRAAGANQNDSHRRMQ